MWARRSCRQGEWHEEDEVKRNPCKRNTMCGAKDPRTGSLCSLPFGHRGNHLAEGDFSRHAFPPGSSIKWPRTGRERANIIGTIDIDQLAHIFGLPESLEFFEQVQTDDSTWNEAYEYLVKEERLTKSQAVKKADKYQQEHDDELMRKYSNSVGSAAGYFFEQCGMELQEVKNEGRYEIIGDAEEAASAIIEIINGIGLTYSSLSDFRESYGSLSEAVMVHLPYLKHYAEVYGTSSARTLFDKSMRY